MQQNTTIAGQKITEHFFSTIIVGSGAAGMNCAKKLYEYMDKKDVDGENDTLRKYFKYAGCRKGSVYLHCGDHG